MAFSPRRRRPSSDEEAVNSVPVASFIDLDKVKTPLQVVSTFAAAVLANDVSYVKGHLGDIHFDATIPWSNSKRFASLWLVFYNFLVMRFHPYSFEQELIDLDITDRDRVENAYLHLDPKSRLPMIKALGLDKDLDKWILKLIEPAELCIEPDHILGEFMKNKTLVKIMKPETKDLIRETLAAIESARKTDQDYIAQLKELPTVPPTTLSHSQELYREFVARTGFGIHIQEINRLGGQDIRKILSQKDLGLLDEMETLFAGEATTTKDTAYAFRGMHVRSLDHIKVNTNSVTFVTLSPVQAMSYGLGPIGSNLVPILMIIRLPPGTPVIRIQGMELILPHRGTFKKYGEPYYFHEYCEGGKIRGPPYGGIALHYDYIPPPANAGKRFHFF